ncbi:hypothetical protein SDC9_110969 [bioreactor metagenome]|uniref:Uncharacterized protein n=1 Tax=bioreactor metagenome TaxID=1076179 RepID=A0A645BLF8_9ZZZZ
MIDDRRSAIRSHHKQPAFIRIGLERFFLFYGHVVGKQHDIDVVVKTALRNVRRVLARHGDDRHVQIRVNLQCAFKRWRHIRRRLGSGLLVEQLVNLFQRRLERRVAFAIHGYKKVIRRERAFQLRRGNADVLRNLLV